MWSSWLHLRCLSHEVKAQAENDKCIIHLRYIVRWCNCFEKSKNYTLNSKVADLKGSQKPEANRSHQQAHHVVCKGTSPLAVLDHDQNDYIAYTLTVTLVCSTYGSKTTLSFGGGWQHATELSGRLCQQLQERSVMMRTAMILGANQLPKYCWRKHQRLTLSISVNPTRIHTVARQTTLAPEEVPRAGRIHIWSGFAIWVSCHSSSSVISIF